MIEKNIPIPCSERTITSLAHRGTYYLGENLYRTINTLHIVKLLDFETKDIIFQASRWIKKSFMREDITFDFSTVAFISSRHCSGVILVVLWGEEGVTQDDDDQPQSYSSRKETGSHTQAWKSPRNIAYGTSCKKNDLTLNRTNDEINFFTFIQWKKKRSMLRVKFI